MPASPPTATVPAAGEPPKNSKANKVGHPAAGEHPPALAQKAATASAAAPLQTDNAISISAATAAIAPAPAATALANSAPTSVLAAVTAPETEPRHKPPVAASASLEQSPTIAITAKPADAAVIFPSQANPVTVAAPNALPHLPSKTAEIIRQISAALPSGSLVKPLANPALHISLTPETLGTITVKIAQHASGDTAVTITASQPETLAVLKHDASNLNQVLTNAGVPDANRQLDFQTLPVAAPQISAGLGNTGGQFAQNGNGQNSQQTGTAFAGPFPGSVATASPTAIAAPRNLNNARTGVDVIA